MKALWKGYITLGRLGIPVRLYAASQSSGVKFVQLHEADGSPVERPLFCRREHKEISSGDVVRGVEVGAGKYVTFTDHELAGYESGNEKVIEIRQFCVPAQVEARYYEKPYYLVPTQGGERTYALLREGLTRTAKLAIGTFYFYGNEYISAVGVYEDVLMLYRLRFADEIVPRSDIDTLAMPRANPSEVDMMQAAIERYSLPFHARDYHNAQTERIAMLAERKAKGLPMPRPEHIPADATADTDIPAVLSQIIGQPGDSLPARRNQ